MAETSIEWTATLRADGTTAPGYTFNPWRGCTKVSAGCANCYAEKQSKRNPRTLGIWGDQGSRVVASEAGWREPLKWDRKAKEAGERHRVFCASMADVFEDWQGPMHDSQQRRLWVSLHDGAIITDDSPGSPPGMASCRLLTMSDVRARLFALIDATPNLDWLLLTKRPENVLPVLDRWFHDKEPPPNVWLGTSVENQQTADERIPHLLKAPAAVRFLSCEPLLGEVDLSKWLPIDWVIVGGESGPHARPMHPDWARSIRDQCQAAGVAFFFKQWGTQLVDQSLVSVCVNCGRDSLPTGKDKCCRYCGSSGNFMDELKPSVGATARIDKKAAGRLLDGREWNEFPELIPNPTP